MLANGLSGYQSSDLYNYTSDRYYNIYTNSLLSYQDNNNVPVSNLLSAIKDALKNGNKRELQIDKESIEVFSAITSKF